jgi:hypothetical protein
VREKDRIRGTRAEAARLPTSPAPPKEATSSGTDRLGSMLAFLNKVASEKKARVKQTNLLSNQRKQQRELESLKAAAIR